MFCAATAALIRATRTLVRGAAVVISLALAFGAAAQTNKTGADVSTSAPASTNEATLSLQVIDVETSQPIPDVKIRAWVHASPTDKGGVSVIPVPKPTSENFSYRISLAKDGYVGETITWSKGQGDKFTDIPTNLVAKMEKGVSIGGTVKNDNGEPVPGARVIFSGISSAETDDRARSVIAPNYHVERTDAEGHWHYGEAPRDFERLTFRVVHPDFFPTLFAAEGALGDTTIKILPKADFLAGKAAMILGHGLELLGKVVDPNGKPIADATVTRNHEWRNPAAQLMTDTNGEFKILNLRPGEMYLTVQSPGMAGWAQLLTLSNGMPDLKIELARGNVFNGRIVEPSGKPVIGATVQMDREERGPIEFEWSATSDNDGRFSWDSAPEGPHPYLFMAGGYHPRSEPSIMADGKEQVFVMRRALDGDQTIVDGFVTDADTKKPLTDFTVYVKNYSGRAISHSRQSSTTTDGHYSVGVPSMSGGYVVTIGAPGYAVKASRLKDVGDGDLRMDFAMKPDPSASGRLYTLAGQFVLNDYKGSVTWTNQAFTLANVVPDPPLKSVDEDARREELQAFLMTDEGRAWQDSHRTYDVEVDATGAFKVDELPEGPYHLDANLRDGPAGKSEPIAGLSLDLDVPGSAPKTNAVVDIGTIPLAPKKVLHLGDAAPLFEVKTVDGTPLRLADYRGKVVLLDFWATWCGPCVAETPYLKATYKKFGGLDRFAIIGLSLDNDPSAPKAFAAKEGVKWIQGFLGQWSKSDVAPKYGVEGIPAIFLIDADGRILAKDLRGEAIKEAVGAALGND